LYYKELLGKTFGRWTIIDIIKKEKSRIYFQCICDCGKIKEVYCSSVISGKSKSCGCLSKELIRKRNKKQNDFDLYHSCGYGYTYKKEIFYFDLEDYELIKNYCWHINKQGYISTFIYKENKRKQLFFHRLVMNPPDNLDIDHIDHQLNNNQKSNLRYCNSSLNLMNSKLRKDNTSGYKGISWNKEKQKFEVYLCINQKNIKLGYYKNIEDAITIRENAELKYFGEFKYKG
jgi:hypothetical protein